MNFLIINSGKYGDCLYATTVAKQIKFDFPKCKITWAIETKYSSILNNNPHVDEVLILDLPNDDYLYEFYKKSLLSNVYDKIIITQILRSNWVFFDGTIRSGILNSYKKKITVDVTPVLNLTQEEISNVNRFIVDNKIKDFNKVIIFECSPSSGQSYVSFEYAINVAESICNKYHDVCFILTSPQRKQVNKLNIFFADTLTFRENAELIKYCDLLVGCSSGITWLSTSSWIGKKIKNIQLLSKDYPIYTGLKYDHQLWDLEHNHISEYLDITIEEIINIINTFIISGYDNLVQDNISYIPNVSHFKNVFGYMVSNIDLLKKHSFFSKCQITYSFILNFQKSNKHLRLSKLFYVAFRIIVVNCIISAKKNLV
jgi:ADP-heptose:LPS heptosyltransferase